MALIENLLSRIESSGDDTGGNDYYECRRCGCTLAREDDACANCGSEDVACFVF